VWALKKLLSVSELLCQRELPFNVKTRLLRARLFLREQLSAYYDERLTREE
jgi:hypothetical protein